MKKVTTMLFALITLCVFNTGVGFSSEIADSDNVCAEHETHTHLLKELELTATEQKVVNEELHALLKDSDPEMILAAKILLSE